MGRTVNWFRWHCAIDENEFMVFEMIPKAAYELGLAGGLKRDRKAWARTTLHLQSLEGNTVS